MDDDNIFVVGIGKVLVVFSILNRCGFLISFVELLLYVSSTAVKDEDV